MIINGGSRQNWRFFATHLMRADSNERVNVAEIRGVMAEDIKEALREMDAVAAGWGGKNFMYHADLNPRDHETLTPEQWREAIDRLEHNLGLDGHARVVVEHLKEGREHVHVIWNRIDPETMTAVSDSHDYRKHQETSRELEELFGLDALESVTVKDRGTDRPERRPKDWETFRAQATKIDPHQMKVEITALWSEADSGLAFQAALEDAGYILARGDKRDFVLIDAAGDDHSLARRISGAKAAEIRSRLSDIDKEALPSVAEARELARDRMDAGGTDSGLLPQPEPQNAPQFAAPSQAEMVTPFPEISPDLEREFAARWEDWMPMEVTAAGGKNERQAEPENRLTPEEDRQHLHPEPEASDEGLRAEPQFGGAPEEPHRASPWGRAWRAFSDAARAAAEHIAQYLRDEASGTPEEERGPWVRLIGAGRKFFYGLRHNDAAELHEAAEEAARIAREEALRHLHAAHPNDPHHSEPPPDEHARDQSWPGGKVEPPEPDKEPQREEASLSAMDELARAWMESDEFMEPGEEETPSEPEEPELDGPDIEP